MEGSRSRVGEGGGGGVRHKVRCERRALRRSYYVDVCRWWEAVKIDDETYWLCGADSDCSVFDEPL